MNVPTNAANLGFLLAKALQRWNERFYAGLERRGLHDVRPAYGPILLALFEQEGLRMGELARRAWLSKQTVTALVRDMRDRGLVRRIRDAEDARAFRIYLSSRARKLRSAIEEVLGELDAEVDASPSKRDVEQLRTSLLALMEFAGTFPNGHPTQAK